ILLRGIDLSLITRCLDISCGNCADLIALAKEHKQLELHGYNASLEQIEIGNRKILANQLEDRIKLFHRNYCIDEFPDQYELIMGFQAISQIRDRQALFSNITGHLKSEGFLILSEIVSNTASAIEYPELSAYFISKQQWAEFLAGNSLRVVESIDITWEISNSLFDPNFAENLSKLALDDVIESYVKGIDRLGELLRRKLISYLVLTVQRDQYSLKSALLRNNAEKLNRPILYSMVLSEIKDSKSALVYQPDNILNAADSRVPSNNALLRKSELLNSEPTEQRLLLENYYRVRVSSILGLLPSELDLDQSLISLGLDSLMALELKNHSVSHLGINISLAKLLEGISVTQLVSLTLSQLPDRSLSLSTISSLPLSLNPGRENGSNYNLDHIDSDIVYPLSFGQRSLWFLYQLAPESWAYNVVFAVRICSDIDVPALRCAFQSLIDRHRSLKSTYFIQNGEPVQKVDLDQKIDFEEIDCSSWSSSLLNTGVVEESRRTFDLERGPICRVRLFFRSSRERVLLFSTHHIAIDLWSLYILIDELEKLYSAENTNISIDLPLIKLQYSDYVQWQSNMLSGLDGKRLSEYWGSVLSGDLPIVNLPSDRPRPPMQTFNGGTQLFKIDQRLTQQLNGIAKANAATLYTTLLAAFFILVYRYTRQQDIIIGSPIAGRNRPEFIGTVGYFVNLVALRADLSGDATFIELLSKVRQIVINALEHQDYPLALLVERLQPQRDPSRSPLFDIVFSLETLASESHQIQSLLLGETDQKIKLGEFLLEPIQIAQQEGQFDLDLHMFKLGESISATLQYNCDLFDDTTIVRMADHFQTLLKSIVADSNARISTLPVLTETELYQLLVGWNNTRASYPKDKPIHKLFEEQVEKSPDTTAIVCGQDSITYRELNKRANQMARYLQEFGLEPEQLVGICMERSIETISCMLAILKSSGAYLPIDPTYPKDRLNYMLKDAGVKVLLCKESIGEISHELAVKLICIDSEWIKIASQSQENIATITNSDNLAYA
ncbi:MAG: condensation domain-containing protein, partial [Acidobacteriota bacterium]